MLGLDFSDRNNVGKIRGVYSRGTELGRCVRFAWGTMPRISGIRSERTDPGVAILGPTIDARFDNVAGLTTRAKESAAGVTVGRVVGIRMMKNSWGHC